RLSPVIFGTARITIEEVELAGVTVPAGTFVSVNTSAANRDPSVYADPDHFDLDRAGPPPHLTFGGGPHYCLGANLAKNELAEAFALLSRRLPGLEVTGPAPWKPVSGISGPSTLPIRFAPGH
ncbi:MAG TPA: cytochrome P450, partial [Acidimicrobiales bacterium]